MTPKNTYRVTILVTVDEEYNACDILAAVHEECGIHFGFGMGNYPFLHNLDAEIDDQDVEVEPVRLDGGAR